MMRNVQLTPTQLVTGAWGGRRVWYKTYCAQTPQEGILLDLSSERILGKALMYARLVYLLESGVTVICKDEYLFDLYQEALEAFCESS